MTGIIYYGAGNLFSLKAALDRLEIAYEVIESGPIAVEKYDRFIIPGVGHAGTAMERLQLSGMADDVKALKKPVLGICVGMQLLTDFSEEGNASLLGVLPLRTQHFSGQISEKVPHMGWNRLQVAESHPLFEGLSDHPYFYFVHSYYIEYSKPYTIATGNYGIPFSAAFQKDNFYGVQFHPEKSGTDGERLLRNFCKFN